MKWIDLKNKIEESIVESGADPEDIMVECIDIGSWNNIDVVIEEQDDNYLMSVF